jgi:catechol 2,3-dioxygenase-like lactoylglutathione lyase family enzyme
MEAFQVEQIDHVHVHVSDRETAAAWYARVPGFAVANDVVSRRALIAPLARPAMQAISAPSTCSAQSSRTRRSTSISSRRRSTSWR